MDWVLLGLIVLGYIRLEAGRRERNEFWARYWDAIEELRRDLEDLTAKVSSLESTVDGVEPPPDDPDPL